MKKVDEMFMHVGAKAGRTKREPSDELRPVTPVSTTESIARHRDSQARVRHK